MCVFVFVLCEYACTRSSGISRGSAHGSHGRQLGTHHLISLGRISKACLQLFDLGQNPKYGHTFRDESYMGVLKGRCRHHVWNIVVVIQTFVEKCLSQELRSAATKLPWRRLFSKECMASDLMASRTCQFVEFDLAVIVLCSPGFPRCHKFDD